MTSYKKENPGRNNTPPFLRMCHCLGKACPAQGGGGHPQDFDTISATNPTYILTKNYIYGFQIAFISKT
jgi:hypothetical protein